MCYAYNKALLNSRIYVSVSEIQMADQKALCDLASDMSFEEGKWDPYSGLVL